MNILFLSRWFPYPANNGARLRVQALLRGLSAHHRVTLISFGEPRDEVNLPHLRELCTAAYLIPFRPYRPTSARALVSLASPTPRSLVDVHVPQMTATIGDELRRTGYDLIVASEMGTAAYAPAFRGVPAIFEELEVGAFETWREQASSLASTLRRNLSMLKLQSYLRRLLPRFKATTVVSPAEQALLPHLAPGSRAVELIPNCVDLAAYDAHRVAPRPNTLVFTGSLTFEPNYHAMTWFIAEVLPLVKARVPNVQLIITGDHGGRPLPSLDGVTLTGMVDDVKPVLGAAWLAVAPIHQGGGTRLKILEALAMGTPVVATTKGAEGLAVESARDLLLADTPEATAEAVTRVLVDPALRDDLSRGGRRLVADQYDWAAVLPRFLDLAERAAHA